MKLTKEEIKFIDNYLIKNEVKYWDVRLELLDHIVSSVEDKMMQQGVSFNEALLEVHCGFGNQFIEFGIPKKEIFKKGLYQSNIGFKKFMRQKQKEIRRKHSKMYWRTFLPFVFSYRFLFEILVLAFLAFLGNLYSFKASFIVLTIAIIGVELCKLFYGGLKKISKKSLNMQMAAAASLLTLQVPYMSLMFFKWVYEGVETKPYYLLFIFCFLIFVISRHSLNHYIRIYKMYKERFELSLS